jgi:hypothetical protein
MICPSLNRLFLIARLLMTDSRINRGMLRGAGQPRCRPYNFDN